MWVVHSPAVRFILKALAKSMVPLVFVSVMQLCVMIFFTFLGMELFQGCGLHYGCFANYTDPSGRHTHTHTHTPFSSLLDRHF